MDLGCKFMQEITHPRLLICSQLNQVESKSSASQSTPECVCLHLVHATIFGPVTRLRSPNVGTLVRLTKGSDRVIVRPSTASKRLDESIDWSVQLIDSSRNSNGQLRSSWHQMIMWRQTTRSRRSPTPFRRA